MQSACPFFVGLERCNKRSFLEHTPLPCPLSAVWKLCVCVITKAEALLSWRGCSR